MHFKKSNFFALYILFCNQNISFISGAGTNPSFLGKLKFVTLAGEP